jgi:putative salt-induced outer membrane protein YdiY
VKVSVDTGYRMKGYADDGIAGTGPILRGQVEWQQALSKRTRLSQTTRVETGQHGAYLRNSLQVKTQLQPKLTLSSGLETSRDSQLTGRNKTDATMNLRYAF